MHNLLTQIFCLCAIIMWAVPFPICGLMAMAEEPAAAAPLRLPAGYSVSGTFTYEIQHNGKVLEDERRIWEFRLWVQDGKGRLEAPDPSDPSAKAGTLIILLPEKSKIYEGRSLSKTYAELDYKPDLAGFLVGKIPAEYKLIGAGIETIRDITCETYTCPAPSGGILRLWVDERKRVPVQAEWRSDLLGHDAFLVLRLEFTVTEGAQKPELFEFPPDFKQTTPELFDAPRKDPAP